MKIIKDIPYEDGLVIAENYAMQEREITNLKKQIAELKQTILSLNLKTKEQNDIVK